MSVHSVEEWAHQSITYRHLIRPVVSHVRDHGPVAVDRVRHVILHEAAGDLRDASPTRDRDDAAPIVLDFMCEDIDAMTLADGIVSIPAGTTRVTSALFGDREIPTAERREADREASQRRMRLREWVGKNLFATKWRNGIREHGQDEVDWMVEQITSYGYIGPKIVRDAELGSIIDGGLRFRALDVMGLDAAEHTVTMEFVNDMHRLAYVIAAHSLPGGKTRIPASLRDAILRSVVPRGTSLLRTKAGSGFHEPTPDEWLDITGRDHAAPVVREVKVKATVEPQPVSTVATDQPVPVVDVTEQQGRDADFILSVIVDDEEWVTGPVLNERLVMQGIRIADTGRTLRKMAASGGPLEKRSAGGRGVEYRPRRIRVPVVGDGPRRKGRTADGRAILPDAPTTAKEAAVRFLVDEAKRSPNTVFPSKDVDGVVTRQLQSEKPQRGSYLLYDEVRGTRAWQVDGEPWTIEVDRIKKAVWLRAVRG